MAWKAAALVALFTHALTVAAHGRVIHIENAQGESFGGPNPDVNAVKKPGQAGWAMPGNFKSESVGWKDYGHPDVICHREAIPGPGSIKVKPLDKIKIQWAGDFRNHGGPVINYLAKCDGDCVDDDKEKLKWFKISQDGVFKDAPPGGRQQGFWAAHALSRQKNSWNVIIPKLPCGQYAFRHEIIALHAIWGDNGKETAQHYPMCFNIDIECTGGAEDAKLPEGVIGTKLYRPDEPGTITNLYGAVGKYPFPGPAFPVELLDTPKPDNGGTDLQADKYLQADSYQKYLPEGTKPTWKPGSDDQPTPTATLVPASSSSSSSKSSSKDSSAPSSSSSSSRSSSKDSKSASSSSSGMAYAPTSSPVSSNPAECSGEVTVTSVKTVTVTAEPSADRYRPRRQEYKW